MGWLLLHMILIFDTYPVFKHITCNTKDNKKEKEQADKEEVPHSEAEESNEPALFRCTGPCSSLQKHFSNRVEYELHMEYFHVNGPKEDTSFGEL